MAKAKKNKEEFEPDEILEEGLSAPAPAKKRGRSTAAKTKICRECGQEKPVSDFYRNKLTEDGFQHICKICKNKRRTDTGIPRDKMVLCFHGEKIVIDSSVVESLTDDADAQFRPVLYQAAWQLSKAVEGA